MTPPDVSSGSDDRYDRELAELVREFATHPPPPPTEATWQQVRDRIATRLTPATPPPARRSKWVAVAAIATLAACVLVGLTVWSLTPRTGPAAPAEVAFDPLAEYEVLPIATSDDVMVSVVRGDGIDFASIDHPIPPVMPLATAGDLTVEQAYFGRAVEPDAPDAPWVVAEPQDK